MWTHFGFRHRDNWMSVSVCKQMLQHVSTCSASSFTYAHIRLPAHSIPTDMPWNLNAQRRWCVYCGGEGWSKRLCAHTFMVIYGHIRSMVATSGMPFAPPLRLLALIIIYITFLNQNPQIFSTRRVCIVIVSFVYNCGRLYALFCGWLNEIVLWYSGSVSPFCAWRYEKKKNGKWVFLEKFQ